MSQILPVTETAFVSSTQNLELLQLPQSSEWCLKIANTNLRPAGFVSALKLCAGKPREGKAKPRRV